MTTTETNRPDDRSRSMLVVSHTLREDAVEAALRVLDLLDAAGVAPVLEPQTWQELTSAHGDRIPAATRVVGDTGVAGIELAIVLGGDGTILRAVEVVRETDTPILGVNLGHVGFLAESERDSLEATVERALERDYVVEERTTLEVSVELDGEPLHSTWALNDASIEKATHERMLEVVIEVDGQPLSSFGCDGVLFSTPTGSTAYSFSAGGPIVWPTVDALLLVPVSAHALFARPIVVASESVLAVEVLRRTIDGAVLACDGRRTFPVPPGARITATRSDRPVRLARLHEVPFSRRLVDKFRLPTTGWRGPAHA